MELEIDSDVKAVAEFMQGNLAASKLVAVSKALAQLAPMVWGHFEPEGIAALRFKSSLSVLRAERTQPSAKQSAVVADADGGSVAEAS